jgi:YebC/PmpR family DNA-binding regulatory protein
MAGHSKWAQIKRQKAVTDAKKSKIFSKFAQLIALESKKAGGNTESPSLRAVIERAKAANMPKDNIDRAVAKGKAGEGAQLERLTYECYGPGGVAVLIDTLTDNRNRTAQELKHLLSLSGIALANPGSASWAFAKLPDGSWGDAHSTVELSDEDLAKLDALVDALEERDDVQAVVANVA